MADELPAITIGMAVANDFDGAYFTVQSLRLHQQTRGCEILIVDNFGDRRLQGFCEEWRGARYVLENHPDRRGTAYPRQKVFELASCDFVVCLDSHVLLWPGAVAKLRKYFAAYPDTADIVTGPMLYDDLKSIATHMNPAWSDGMFGVWQCDPRGVNPEGEPFEIPMHGLGLFAMRKAAWPGFNPLFKGFGGEEGYIHWKVKQRGGRTLCLPFLRWLHKFRRDGDPVNYRNAWDDRIYNYAVGLMEVGAPLDAMVEHFLRLGITGLGPAQMGKILACAKRDIVQGPPERKPA